MDCYRLLQQLQHLFVNPLEPILLSLAVYTHTHTHIRSGTVIAPCQLHLQGRLLQSQQQIMESNADRTIPRCVTNLHVTCPFVLGTCAGAAVYRAAGLCDEGCSRVRHRVSQPCSHSWHESLHVFNIIKLLGRAISGGQSTSPPLTLCMFEV